MSLGGSFHSPNIEDYYATPWDYGYGHIVKFDHDFVGRAALEELADEPHRRKVTLVWNADDVLGVYQRLLEEGPLPIRRAPARRHCADALRQGARLRRRVGRARDLPDDSVNERAMLSLATLEEAHAEPGTEVVLLWGEPDGGARSAPWIEPHVQVEIRATVAPAPISQAAQQYRSAVDRWRRARPCAARAST